MKEEGHDLRMLPYLALVGEILVASGDDESRQKLLLESFVIACNGRQLLLYLLRHRLP
jgi:hypothetical protein